MLTVVIHDIVMCSFLQRLCDIPIDNMPYCQYVYLCVTASVKEDVRYWPKQSVPTALYHVDTVRTSLDKVAEETMCRFNLSIQKISLCS